MRTNSCYSTQNSETATRKSSLLCLAKYLVVVASRGMISEVNHFATIKDAKRAFGKIALDHRYKPSEINGSDYYHVSIWEWTGDRYEDINYYP